MIRIRLPHRFPLPAAVGIALALAPGTGALASPALPDAAAVRQAIHGPSWLDTWRPLWAPVEPEAVSSHFPGLWVNLDPVSRRPVTPTMEQRRAAQAALLPSGAPDLDEMLPAERIPGGGELIHLNGRHMVFSVARRDASGRFTTTCVSDSLEAARIIASPAPARPAPTRRRWEEK